MTMQSASPPAGHPTTERSPAADPTRRGWSAGILGALIGVAVWVLLTALARVDLAAMALLVGLLTGRFMRRGSLRGARFVLAAIGVTLAACLMGDVLSAWVRIAGSHGYSLLEAVTGLPPMRLFQVIFDPLDGVFYGVSAYIAAAHMPVIRAAAAAPTSGKL